MTKVWVDEMPADCVGCPVYDGDRGVCRLLRDYTEFEWGERPTNCPLEKAQPAVLIRCKAGEETMKSREEETDAHLAGEWGDDRMERELYEIAISLGRIVDMLAEMNRYIVDYDDREGAQEGNK